MMIKLVATVSSVVDQPGAGRRDAGPAPAAGGLLRSPRRRAKERRRERRKAGANPAAT